ncbi:hypothetical protein CAE01nite_30120 [Cellulomonas aerilata]|uniref:GGDEF-domain containing protein n=1 Tax=Cellulomonas aerilata TaxID=515326 RepID=A0A512DFN8_9CELL|nr:hypothetical protein CAE01nite_30120 [Cellulomonas aerilata]
MPWRLHAFLASVCVLGALGLVLTLWLAPWPSLSGTQAWSIAFLAVAAIVGEVRPVPISRGTETAENISTSAPFVLASVAVGGVGVAVVVQVVASLCDDVVHRRPLLKSAFNTAQYVLSVLAARAVFCALTGLPYFADPVPVGPRHLGALLLAGVTMVAVNRLLVAVVVSLATTLPLDAVVRDDARFVLATHAVLLCIGGVAAAVAQDGVTVLALLVAPVVAVYATAAAASRHAHQASHDALTGLGNRERLHRQLDAHLAAAQGPGSGPGLVLLDLDHFKTINDSLGHPVGDVLLREVAARLCAALGDDVSAHRLGGDEFAVVVDGDLPQTLAVAHRLLTSLEAPMRVDRLELLVRASAGVAVAPDHGTTSDALMKNADIALYHAKLERDRISTYSPALDVNSVDRLQLLADLRVAIDTGQLDVAYQVQVDLTSGHVVAVEALIRWRHPQRGPVAPDDFIPLAENSGLIAELTSYVLDNALAALAGWRAAGHDLRMSVNLSTRHLSDLALPRQVAEALARHGVEPGALVLEVTETGILSDPARVDVVIAALREQGVAIAVDDYGTGHASLGYLKRLEIDELKVDRSFVSDMRRNHQDFVIVRSTIALARDLGLRVVAEGIEDADTARSLAELGCDVGQGYHLGRPTSAAEIVARLSDERRAAGAAAAARIVPGR